MASRKPVESRRHVPVQRHEKKAEAYHDRMDASDHMTKRGGGTETHKGMDSGETTMGDKSKPLGNDMTKFGGVMGGRVDSGD